MSLITRILPPRSWCAECAFPFFSDRRRPCPRCGETARVFRRAVTDSFTSRDKAS